MRKHRFRNSYFISAVSVSLVLCLIGLECVLLLSAGALITRMRENITVTAVLTKDADSIQCAQLETIFANPQHYSGYTYISEQQALDEHILLWVKILQPSWVIIPYRPVMRFTLPMPSVIRIVWR